MFRYILSATGPTAVTPLPFGEAAERQLAMLHLLDQALQTSDGCWTFERVGSMATYAPEELAVEDTTAFVQQALAFESEKRQRSPIRSEPSRQSLQAVSHAEFSLTYTSPNVEGLSVRMSNSSHRDGSFTLVHPGLEETEQRALEMSVLQHWPAKSVLVSQAETSAELHVNKEVRVRSDCETWLKHYGRSYLFGLGPFAELHPSITQRVADGYLLLETPGIFGLATNTQQDLAIEVGTTLAKHPRLLRQLQLPEPLYPLPLHGVPVERAPDQVDELYWVVRSSRTANLEHKEVDALLDLARKQCALDIRGPIIWIVEQPHILEQLQPLLSPFAPRISTEQGRHAHRSAAIW